MHQSYTKLCFVSSVAKQQVDAQCLSLRLINSTPCYRFLRALVRVLLIPDVYIYGTICSLKSDSRTIPWISEQSNSENLHILTTHHDCWTKKMYFIGRLGPLEIVKACHMRSDISRVWVKRFHPIKKQMTCKVLVQEGENDISHWKYLSSVKPYCIIKQCLYYYSGFEQLALWISNKKIKTRINYVMNI